MSRVVTQPSPCEPSSRSVAPMSFSLWSIAGERELTRAAAGLDMRDGWCGSGVRIEQMLTNYERLLNTMSSGPAVFRAVVYFAGSGARLYGCLGSLSGGRYGCACWPAGPRLLMYWYIARRSCSVVSFMLHQGIGGRGLNVLMYWTHCSSVIAGAVRRRLDA